MSIYPFDCSKAKRNRIQYKASEYRDLVLSKMKDDPNDPHHGTLFGYNCGCRCDKCRQVMRDYYKNHKPSKEKAKAFRTKALYELETNPNDSRHGTPTGYAYGCRCERCRLAAKKYRYKLQKQKRDAK